jgi:hypothetical protein
VFAVFAEDALVPVVALDTLLPLLASEDRKASKREIRRWLQQLLKANLLRGSIEGGVSVHDLVRDCMIRRAEAAHEGGLCAMQREGVPLLVDAFEGKNAGAEYVAASLHIHVRGALQPKLAIHMDSLLMRVLSHEHAKIRRQGMLGVGVDTLSAAADVCDTISEHLSAAQIMFAAASGRGSHAGIELRRASGSLRRLTEAGGDTS